MTVFIASVWFINGFACKILNLVPRHEQIVATILGDEYSRILIILIGISEVGMAIWVLSKFKSRISAMTQIILVMTMNILEFTLAPNLLLWGQYNIMFAMLFILLVWYNEFAISKDQKIIAL